MPEADQLQLMNTIMEIRVELGKLSTRLEKLDDFNRSLDDFRGQLKEIYRRSEEVEKLAVAALESTKSAHKRLNAISKVSYWLLTAIGGAVVVFVVGFALKGGFYIK
ncbi:hypothetical protein [Paenibacillus sp. P22]|uniref:hypothetical protein n=1 Tax=Paenibacillus sp. P22 TaxID=483908 RepID=UPI00038F8E5E|nr:hypothetical protein [Paenibacillus sp. P22]CDN44186.1 hypothetical protein BN871_EI_00150 [Paenibacillus sp. P22]